MTPSMRMCRHTTPNDMPASIRFMSRQRTSHHITSHRIASHHITSHVVTHKQSTHRSPPTPSRHAAPCHASSPIRRMCMQRTAHRSTTAPLYHCTTAPLHITEHTTPQYTATQHTTSHHITSHHTTPQYTATQHSTAQHIKPHCHTAHHIKKKTEKHNK